MFFLKLKNSGDVFVDIKMGIYKSKTNFIGPEGPKAHANKTSINSMINISTLVEIRLKQFFLEELKKHYYKFFNITHFRINIILL